MAATPSKSRQKRYRLVKSTDPSGAYAEFTKTSDAEAVASAQARLYGARIVDLVEVLPGNRVRAVSFGS